MSASIGWYGYHIEEASSGISSSTSLGCRLRILRVLLHWDLRLHLA